MFRELFRRLRPNHLAGGEFDTAGPPEDEAALLAPSVWGDRHIREGWWVRAEQRDIHPGRMGRVIRPTAVVVHTTDMLPPTFGALIKSWQTSAGVGAGAHVLIGRTPADGTVQMVPFGRNANHAGGRVVNGRPLYGGWVLPNGTIQHPNLVSVGIEIHAAGKLRWKQGSAGRVAEMYSYPERRVIAEFQHADVYVDSLGRPWHRVTQYQVDQLESLLRALRDYLHSGPLGIPRPGAAHVKDRSYWDNSYAATERRTLVGHATLNPTDKTDPGPQIMLELDRIAKKESYE